MSFPIKLCLEVKCTTILKTTKADLPFNTHGNLSHHGRIQWKDEHVSLHPAHHGPQQPTTVEHEHGDLWYTEEHDEQVTDGQVHDEEIRHWTPHLAIPHDEKNHQSISNYSNNTYDAK